MMRSRRWARGLFPLAWVLVAGALWKVGLSLQIGLADQQKAPADGRAGWGTDHVAAPLPEYVTGDECLFCHRDQFGNDWSKNWHQRTVRPADPESPAIALLKADAETRKFADQVDLVMGGRNATRFLKRENEYGKLAILSAAYAPPSFGGKTRRPHGALVGAKNARWDGAKFAESCAGCHATAVDPKTHAFSALSLDCYACHGIVDLKHSKDTKLVYFGKGRDDAPPVVASICGQCHLRNGKSRASGLPYPTNFVAGDNLFRDFKVGLTDVDLAAMNPGDRHVAENVRDVFDHKTNTSCISCHDVHHPSTARHRKLADAAGCAACHVPGKPKSQWKRYEAHSALCGY